MVIMKAKTIIWATIASIPIWALIAWAAMSLANAQMPPRQFQGGTEARIAFMAQDQVNWLCNTKRQANTLQACVIDGTIIAPNPCQAPGPYARIMCHEMAHINGYPAEHPSS